MLITVLTFKFMILSVGAKSFKEGLRMCRSIPPLKKVLSEEEACGVGDEGGLLQT